MVTYIVIFYVYEDVHVCMYMCLYIYIRHSLSSLVKGTELAIANVLSVSVKLVTSMKASYS